MIHSPAMQGTPVIHQLHGSDLTPWLDALGHLRIQVFRDFPYLYDGSLDYERDYLRTYAESPEAMVVIVTDPSGKPIGATTCIPLSEETSEFRIPFEAAGIDPNRVMYFGESILLPEWRGVGIGKEFFNRREAHALKMGKDITAFCAVDRSESHPLRPADYRPLDEFWKSRGYLRHPQMKAVFTWKEIGEDAESPKNLTFWTRVWTP